MAEHPIIAEKKPAKVELKEGESYTWCRYLFGGGRYAARGASRQFALFL
jgi:hypothetical protein